MQQTDPATKSSLSLVKTLALGFLSADSEARPLTRQRSLTIDNADLSDIQRGSVEHSDVDDERHSLPSLENIGDETAGLSSSVETNPDAFTAVGIPAEVLDALSNPRIEDDTPAAEALRANAEIHVAKLSKFARKVHVQTVRRLVKKATLRAKSGNVRGKPPRIPPPARTPSDGATGPAKDISVVHEVDEDELGEKQMDSSIESLESSEDGEIKHDQQVEAMTAQAAAGSRMEMLPEDIVQEEVGRQDDLMEKEPDWQRRIRESEDKIPAEVITATMETGKKVLGNVDPHDILQTHRWRRRRRRSAKDSRKSYVKGKVINGEHELYTLSIAVMLGVRTSIGTTNSKMGGSRGRHWLTSDDFMATEKYEFSPKGGLRTPPHRLSHTFKFKDYSPMAFAYLRRMFGVNEFDFLLSVCGNANFIEFISNAKSGQFFFYSSDGKYMIKTMTNVESKFLRRILPHYFRHCAKNPNTLLPKFLGMYRVKMYHLRRNVKFVIMNSVYHTDRHLHNFYDLKGSLLGREAKPIQDVKKDNDLRKGLPDSAIALRPDVRVRMRQQIMADCEFLQKMDIMDYSMLIGIHNIPLAQERSHASDSLRISHKRQGSLTLGDLMKKKHHSSLPSVDPATFDGDMFSPQSLRHVSIRSPDGQSRAGQSVSSAGSHNLANERSKDSVRQRKRHDEPLSSLQMYEQGYEDDEDGSYLEGSEEYKKTQSLNGSVVKPEDCTISRNEDIEHKKAQTVEQIYWPFHRYYDIYGYRRMVPTPCATCDRVDCSCGRDQALLSGLNIPPFELPLSTRKDGGLVMDTTGFDMPLMVTIHGHEQPCEGKIFYMGIIDILQQYNIRKRFEARYRRLQSSGWQDASCVSPKIYAERFLRFFDEYSQRGDIVVRRDAEQNATGEGEEPIGGSWDSVRITGSPVSDDIEVSEVSHLKED